MRPLWILGCLLCLAAMQTPATAQSALKWSFQRTGFRSTMGTFGMPQTALSMRTNESWPVVYGLDQGMLHAYSLFPVANSGQVPVGPATHWHQIGTNLAGGPLSSSNYYLQAASGAPDGFGVSIQSPFVATPSTDIVVVGNSQAGFQAPQVDANAVTFDQQGNPVIARGTMLPKLPTTEKIFDVAISPAGDVAAISLGSSGGAPTNYWQRSPLLGGEWISTRLPFETRISDHLLLYGPSADLTFDSSSKPHILALNRTDNRNSVMAFSFDVTLGSWTSSSLDVGSMQGPGIADVAAASNDHGIVGAAWVNNGTLKYAYLDTNKAAPQWVVTSVANTTPTGLPLELSQGVGLAFDKAGLPVISFVDRQMRQIWLAYDPPSVFGGGVTDQPGAEGDFNGDGLVDNYDLDAWGTNFGEAGLDGSDFLAWQRNVSFAEPSTTAAAVPEPLALSSGLVAAALLVGSTRGRRCGTHLAHISSAERRRSLTLR